MILVTGATGSFGKATVNFLLQKEMNPNQISVLVRDSDKVSDLKEKGIDVRIGDYDDYSSLLTAFRGIDKLLLVSGSDILNRQQQHLNVINAAKEAGVKHIIYTSFSRKNETVTNPLGIVATAHIETDNAIKASGIPYTILLNSLYADVLPMFFGEKVLETGIFLPAGNGKVPYATRQDMAEVAANILMTDGHENIQYVLSNTENYTMQDAASILSDLTGKEIHYLNPSVEDFISTLSSRGVPKEAIGGIVSFCEAIKIGEFETKQTDFERLLGRKPTSLKDYLKTIYKA